MWVGWQLSTRGLSQFWLHIKEDSTNHCLVFLLWFWVHATYLSLDMAISKCFFPHNMRTLGQHFLPRKKKTFVLWCKAVFLVTRLWNFAPPQKKSQIGGWWCEGNVEKKTLWTEIWKLDINYHSNFSNCVWRVCALYLE
jgi:hypothetical protein